MRAPTHTSLSPIHRPEYPHYNIDKTLFEPNVPDMPHDHPQPAPPTPSNQTWICAHHGMLAVLPQKWCGAARLHPAKPREACSYETGQLIRPGTQHWICENCFPTSIQLHPPSITACTSCGRKRGPEPSNNAYEHMLCDRFTSDAAGNTQKCLTFNLVNAKNCIECESSFPAQLDLPAWRREVVLLRRLAFQAQFWCRVCGQDLPTASSECRNEDCGNGLPSRRRHEGVLDPTDIWFKELSRTGPVGLATKNHLTTEPGSGNIASQSLAPLADSEKSRVDSSGVTMDRLVQNGVWLCIHHGQLIPTTVSTCGTYTKHFPDPMELGECQFQQHALSFNSSWCCRTCALDPSTLRDFWLNGPADKSCKYCGTPRFADSLPYRNSMEHMICRTKGQNGCLKVNLVDAPRCNNPKCSTWFTSLQNKHPYMSSAQQNFVVHDNTSKCLCAQCNHLFQNAQTCTTKYCGRTRRDAGILVLEQQKRRKAGSTSMLQ
ncbi:hypothetical protein CC86DRAFT_61320 [Ophiobolus disseminans]|uniref:Uncharacterized protein n=1 Tax=Ophiobolus disseminans TaxID=1469910 RepID=A0A6A6ZS20_9PLEO|nr:hypothetical protein CC86DRAFT_61320 [Ophiobolus disseminans]